MSELLVIACRYDDSNPISNIRVGSVYNSIEDAQAAASSYEKQRGGKYKCHVIDSGMIKDYLYVAVIPDERVKQLIKRWL